MRKGISTLIVASPDQMRNSLRILLQMVLHLEVIDQADDGLSASRMIASCPANLVFLDANLPDNESWTVLKQIKSKYPQTHCIVLANNSQQKWIAEVMKADSVLLKGFSTTELLITVESLLARQEVELRKSVV